MPRLTGSENKVTVDYRGIVTKLLDCMNNEEDIEELYQYCMQHKDKLLLFLGKIAPKLVKIDNNTEIKHDLSGISNEKLYTILIKDTEESTSPTVGIKSDNSQDIQEDAEEIEGGMGSSEENNKK